MFILRPCLSIGLISIVCFYRLYKNFSQDLKNVLPLFSISSGKKNLREICQNFNTKSCTYKKCL